MMMVMMMMMKKMIVIKIMGFPGGSDGRVRLQCRRPGLDPWVGKIPWRRKWQPTPVSLPGKSHGQRSLASYSSMGSQRVQHDWRIFSAGEIWWNDGYNTVFNGMQTRDRLLERQSENIYWVLKNSCNFPGVYAKETFRNTRQWMDGVHHSLNPVKKGGKPTGMDKLILVWAYDIIWNNV